MANYPLEGPDLSYAQGNANPANFPGQFAIINASRANVGLAVGSYYHRQVDAFRAAGRHILHYFFNGNVNATVCGQFFVANLYEQPGDDYMLDVEDEPSTGTVHWNPAQVLAFDDVVFASRGKHLRLVYLNRSIRDAYDWSAVRARGIELHLAWYNATLPANDEWGDPLAWQYTSAGYDHNRARADLLTTAVGTAASVQEEDMGLPISFVPTATPNDGTVWLVGPIGSVGIRSLYHFSLLGRAAKQYGDKAASDKMLPQEVDIVDSYLRAVGALPAQSVTISISDAQVAEIKAALIAAIPQHLALSLTGDAHA